MNVADRCWWCRRALYKRKGTPVYAIYEDAANKTYRLHHACLAMIKPVILKERDEKLRKHYSKYPYLGVTI